MIITLSQIYMLLQHIPSCFKGWEALDPFVPIPVEDYNELEMRSAIDYYLDRHWLQNPQAGSDIGRRELAALSAHNPYLLMQVCRSL